MQTFIKDLPLNEEMDSNDMAAIQGGISIMNTTVPNLGSIAYPTGNGNTHNPGLPPSGGSVSGGDPGSGGSGGGNYLDGFDGSNDHRPD